MKWPEKLPAYHLRVPIVPEQFDEDQYGEFHEDQTGYWIGVSPDLPEPEADLTVAHEILHAWFRLSGLVRTISDQEEAFCDGLAPLLCQLIKEYQNGEDR